MVISPEPDRFGSRISGAGEAVPAVGDGLAADGGSRGETPLGLELLDPAGLTHLVPEALIGRVAVVPAERVALVAAPLPVRSDRQRRAALPFAVEDRLGRTLDTTHVAMLGLAPDGSVLAGAMSMDDMTRAIARADGRPLIPEQMLLPAPDPNEGGPVWRVWRVGRRALVRVSDGTGFVARTDMLAPLWRLAGSPAVQSCGAALPAEIEWTAYSGPSLTPDARDLAADLRQGRFAPPSGLRRPMIWLTAGAVLAAALHLALAVADLRALRGIAEDLRRDATTALAQSLPTASVDSTPDLVLRQIAAAQAGARGSGFLPLLDDVSRALVAAGPDLSLRALTWSDDTLRLEVEATGLEALQAVETALRSAGLTVSSGSASVGDGAARADLTVRR